MNEVQLRQGMADLLVGEPRMAVDAFEALALGRERLHRRRTRIATATAMLLVAFVAAVAQPLGRALLRDDIRPSVPVPVVPSPLPTAADTVTIAPLCQPTDIQPFAPLRLPACHGGPAAGRLASAFGVMTHGVPALAPFSITLPTGWTVPEDVDGALQVIAGWSIDTGTGSTVQVLARPTAAGAPGTGVAFVTSPTLFGLTAAAPGYQMLPSRGAAAMADWLRSQSAAWLRPVAESTTTVGGRPAWTFDLPPRDVNKTLDPAWCSASAKVGEVEFGCAFLGRERELTQGRGQTPADVVLGPGTTRVVFFDAPLPNGSTVGVAALLYDGRWTPEGLATVRTLVQPVVDSIGFLVGTR